ncbi:hypothetical protein BASA81_006170 [Batrachochytrium salamandrivorans]|nr:hypothetical protein BASA81_006170 [Batrachochytrium salamandrivorans]
MSSSESPSLLQRLACGRKPPAFHSGLRREVELPRMTDLKQIITTDSDGSILVRPCEVAGGTDPSEFHIDYSVYTPPYTGTEAAYCAPIKMSKRGMASLPPVTLMQSFAKAVLRNGDKLALESCDQTRRWTWNEYLRDIKQVSRALISLEFAQFDCINICGFNCPEWLLLDLGAVFAGGMAAGVYASNSSEQCLYQATHSKAKVVAVENLAQLAKYVSADQVPACNAFVVWDESADLSTVRSQFPNVMLFSEFFKLGALEAEHGAELEQRIALTQPGQICALIYTSGTTGKPKAVSITHDNCLWISASTWAHLAGDDDLSNEECGVRVVSFLPLSHVAALMLDVFAPLFCAAYLESSASLHCADANALRGSLLDTLLKVRPTHFFAVPRVYEKFQAKMVDKGLAAPWLQRKISAWARGKAMELCRIRENKHIRAHSKFPSTLEFFASLNMPILEIFGMSELTGPSTITHMQGNGAYKLGGCGVPMAGTELKIHHVSGRDKPGEGEMCFRGRHVMAGYLYDEAKTNEAVDELGWLHSGDVGRVDEDGVLYITGRIKELLIGQGGENVAPVPVEEYIKERLTKGVANFVMCGNNEKFFVALVTPKCLPDPSTGGFTNQLELDARLIDPSCQTAQQASQSPIWRDYIQQAITEYNQNGAASQACRVQKFTILPQDFSIPTEELGPTLKLKRNVVYEKYRGKIAELYLNGNGD